MEVNVKKRIELNGYIAGLERCIEIAETCSNSKLIYANIWNESENKKIEYNKLLKGEWMKRYFYIEDSSLADHGYNNGILVYRLFKGSFPIYVGSNRHIDTTSAYGALAEAKQVIAKIDNHKMKNSYTLVNKSIVVKEL